MSTLSTVNRYQYNTIRVLSVVVKTQLVRMWSWVRILVKSVFFVSCTHYVILRSTKNHYSLVVYFFWNLLPYIIVWPCRCCRSHLTCSFVRHVGITDCRKLKKCNFRVDPSGITSIPYFIQIRPAVLELNYVDRRKWLATNAFISCTSCKERIVGERPVANNGTWKCQYWSHVSYILFQRELPLPDSK
jgi:hypothetical protein